MDFYGINAKANITTEDVTNYIILNEVNSGTITLQANDSGGTPTNLLVGDPDDSVDLYHNGVKVVETASTGLLGNLSNFVIRNNINGGVISLRADDAGGSTRTLLEGDPDGALDLYYDGTKVAETTANGIEGAVWG